jgi:hypothetical protein
MAAARARADADTATGTGFNAWTGMVVISLVATFVGLVFLFMDYSSYSDKPPSPQAIKAMTTTSTTPSPTPTDKGPAAEKK